MLNSNNIIVCVTFVCNFYTLKTYNIKGVCTNYIHIYITEHQFMYSITTTNCS